MKNPRPSIPGAAASGLQHAVLLRIGTLLLLATALPARAALAPTDFSFVRTLTPPAVLHSEIGGFVLDDSLFDALDDNFANLRLFDASDREIPFLLRRRIPSKTMEQLIPFPESLKIQSLQEKENNRIELNVTRDSRQPQPAALEFESNLRNFEKLVTVSGSLDGEHWTVLAKGEPIYDYSRFADVRRDRVRFATGEYTSYRIELSNITEQRDSPLVEIIRQTRGSRVSNEFEATSFRKEPFRIDRLTFYESRQTLVAGDLETSSFMIQGMTVSQDEKRQNTVIHFSTSRQPLSAILLMTEDTNFSREITLEGETAASPKTWQRVAQNRMTRIHVGKVSEERLTLDLPAEARYRDYRLIIHNQDNLPLTVTGLSARQNLREVLFFPKPGQTYRVCWGGGGVMTPPRYDVDAVLAGVPAGSSDLWQLESTQRMPGKGTGWSWQSYSRKALIGALVLMTGILLIVVARLVRKVDLK